jgi:hypothetical protein
MLGMITVTVTRTELEDIDLTKTTSLSSFISMSPGICDVCTFSLNGSLLSLRESDDNFAYLTHAHTLGHQDVILISLRVSAHSSAPCGAVFGRSRL